MMLNFLYPLRKRWARLKGTAPIQTWLVMHIFVGLMSPILIGFHAAFMHNNDLASATWTALGVVVATGLFGRYLYGLVPTADGHVLSAKELQHTLRSYETRTLRHLQHASSKKDICDIIEQAAHGGTRTNLLLAFLHLPVDLGTRHVAIRRARRHFVDHRQYEDFRRAIQEIGALRTQLRAHAGLRRFFGIWRTFHASLAVFLVLLVALHTAVMLLLGFWPGDG